MKSFMVVFVSMMVSAGVVLAGSYQAFKSSGMVDVNDLLGTGSTKTVSVLKEPSVQTSLQDIQGKKAGKEPRQPQSDEEMQVVLRPVAKSDVKPEVQVAAKPAAKTDVVHVTSVKDSETRAKKIKSTFEDKEKVPSKKESLKVEMSDIENRRNGWAVQVSAQTDQAVAAQQLSQAKSAGFNGYLQKAVVNGKQYYRVRLGPVASQKEAQSLRQRAAETSGYTDALVIKE